MMGFIAGSGIYEGLIEDEKELKVKTRYGSVNLVEGFLSGRKAYFIARHGKDHSIPPHKVNYRANIQALHDLGVRRVIGINTVGSLKTHVKPGELVIPYQFMDFTKNRPSTFYENEVVHVDMTDPFCPELKKALETVLLDLDYPYHVGATYICTEGPRFETMAEIKMYIHLKADVVGMTLVPECILAREREMCYASICTVSNFAAGISKDKLTVDEVVEVVKENKEKIREIITKAVKHIPKERACPCKDALKGATL